MSVEVAIPCPQCNRVPNKQNRLITERCGHKKCRLCFLYDEADCLQCMRHLEVGTELARTNPLEEIQGTKTKNNLEEPVVANAINIETETRKRKISSSACAGLTPSNIHFKTTPDGFTEYYCTVCKKYFSRSEQYYHLACANQENKKYRCKVCEKKFSSRSHMNYHMESHEMNIYKCKVCAKTFDKLAILQKHEKHHSALAVNCPECNKEFQHLVSMEAHLAKHRNELKFACVQCENKYATNSLLQQHMLKHSDKKYQCNQCGQRFQRNSSLTLHMKRHSETESYICSICKKRLKDLGTLLRHKDTHASTMKFKCSECELKSMRRDTILRHAKVNHNKNPKECVEVLKIVIPQSTPPLDLTTVQTLEEQFLELSCEENHMELDPPVTVANSVVIKRVGNVAPVAVPILSCSSQASSFIDVVTVAETNFLISSKNKENCLKTDTNNYIKNDYVKQTESNNVSDFENASATTYIDIETVSPPINESYIKTCTEADNLLDYEIGNPALSKAENRMHIRAISPASSTTSSAIETKVIGPAITSVIKEADEAISLTTMETSHFTHMETVRLINMEMGNSNIIETIGPTMESVDKTSISGFAVIKSFPTLTSTKSKTLQVSNIGIAEATKVEIDKEPKLETDNTINIAPIIEPSVNLSAPKNNINSAAKNEINENTSSSKIAWTTLKNIDTNTYATILHKKLRKKYDPIEMYRKILNDAEEASQKQLRENNLAQDIVLPEDMPPESVKPVVVRQRSQSNFTETHWRKNYKYTYQFQDY